MERSEGGDRMRGVKHLFIAIPNRDMRELVEELSALFKDAAEKPGAEKLMELAEQMNEIPHWFEAEFDEKPAHTPGYIESIRVPGTLRDLGPVSPEEMREYVRKHLESRVENDKRRRRTV